MATITGPRPNGLPHVGRLVAVTPARLNKPLKRSPRRHKQGTTEAIPSLRDSYLAASVSAEQVLQTLKESSRFLAVQDLDNLSAPESHMAPFSAYKRLSSGPPSPVPVDTSVAVNVPLSGQEVAPTDTQSGMVPSPVSLHISCLTLKRDILIRGRLQH